MSENNNDDLIQLVVLSAIPIAIVAGLVYAAPMAYVAISETLLQIQYAIFNDETTEKAIRAVQNANLKDSELMPLIPEYKIPITLAISVLIWGIIYYLNRRMGYDLVGRGAIDIYGIKHLLSQESRLTSCTLGKNLLEEPYYSGDWQAPFNPVEYMLLNDAVKVRQDDGVALPLEYIIDEDDVMLDYDLTTTKRENRFLDESIFNDLQRQQLGKPIKKGGNPFIQLIDAGEEYEALVLMILESSYNKDDSARTIKHICSAFTDFSKVSKSTLFQDYKEKKINRENLRYALNRIPQDKSKKNKKGITTSRALIRKYYTGKTKEGIDAALSNHYYINTCFIAFIKFGERMGLPLQAGYHIWLRPINKQLRLITVCYGMPKPQAEVCFIYSHYHFEVILGRKGGISYSPTNKIVGHFRKELQEREII